MRTKGMLTPNTIHDLHAQMGRNLYEQGRKVKWLFDTAVSFENGTWPSFDDEVAMEKKKLREAGVLNLDLTPAQEYQAWTNKSYNRYLDKGLYDIQLRQWLAVLRDHFGPDKMMDHILIMESEADRENKQGMYDRVLDFLDLPPYDKGEGSINVGIVAPDRIAAHNAENSRTYDHAMSAETREDLEAFFRPHNARLHELLSPLGVEISWAKQAYLEMQQ